MTSASDRVVQLPAIPKITISDPSARAILEPIKTIIDAREGRTGSGTDRFVSVRDLTGAGINLTGVQPWTVPPSQRAGTDTTPPGMPTDMLVAAVGMNSHRVSWTNPVDLDLYYIEIYRGILNGFSDEDTKLVAIATVGLDQLGQPTFRDLSGLEPDVTYYYWLRAVDWSGNKSDVAFVGSAAYADNPSIDDILTSLQGDIEYSHLNTALQTPIDAIPGIQTTITNELDHDTGAVYTSLDTKVAAATYNAGMAAVQSSLNVHTTDIGELEAEFFVKLDVNGAVSGFGIVNSSGTTTTIFRTDKFVIVNPTSTIDESPFIVGTVEGVGNVVGINGTLVVDGTILSNAIETNAITATKIDGSGFGNLTITSGTLTIQTANGLTISGGGDLVVSSGGDLSVAGGTVSITSSGAFNITSGSLNISSSGTVVFSSGTTMRMNATTGSSAAIKFYRTNGTVLCGSVYCTTSGAYMYVAGENLYIDADTGMEIQAGANMNIGASNIDLSVSSQIELYSSSGGYIAVNSIVEIESMSFSGTTISGVSNITITGAIISGGSTGLSDTIDLTTATSITVVGGIITAAS